MTDPRGFETRLSAALGRYADQVPTDVDVLAFVHATRAPTAVRSIWMPSRTLRLALLLGLLSALAVAAAILVGGGTPPSPTPAGITNGWIAYATEPGVTGSPQSHDPSSDIYLVREGGEPRLLVGGGDETTRNVCPGFSADGKHLAYGEGLETSAATLESEQRAIVVVALDPDGSMVEPALRLPVPGTGLVPCPIWAPSGDKLAYPDGDAIAIVWLDGTSSLIPDWDPGLTGPWDRTFAWSPDGMSIAAARPSGTWLLPIDGGAPRQLLPAHSTYVSWSPDGAWIGTDEKVFRRRCTDDSRPARCRKELVRHHSQTRLLSVDGQRETVDLGAGTGGPLWSPSGDRLVFWSEDGLVTANADGSDARVLHAYSYGGVVTWSPDGRFLLSTTDSGGSWDLRSVSIDQGSLLTVVQEIPTSSLKSWPGRGDISWQAVIP